MAHDQFSINLLRKETSSLDRFITWALSIGRTVVIVTELIALSAFLYRFSLDRQLIDLRDQIKQKQNILLLLNKNETTYRNLQDRLALVSQLEGQAKQTVLLFQEIRVLTPRDAGITNYSVSKDRLTIEVHFRSISSLKTFVDSLKKYPGIKSVSIDKIENKISNASLVVSIQAKL